MTIGVISDTHGLLRPEAVEALQGVDHILHAGDVGKAEILEQLAEIAPLTAVRGNIDKPHQAWAAALPLTEAVELGGQLFYMLHIRQELDLDPAAAGIRVVVFGHSHKSEMEEKEGVLYLNPGSAGPRRFRLPITLGHLQITGDQIAARIVELEVNG